MSRRVSWIIAAVCLLAVGLAGFSALAKVGPLAGLLWSTQGVVRPSDVPACGPAWRVVPAAATSLTYNELHALAAIAPDNVWAAGIYGGEEYALTLVENWDGTGWKESASSSVPDFSNHLYGMAAVEADDIWIVGASHQGTSLWRSLALRWNGVEWSIVPMPSKGRISSLNAVAAAGKRDVWAVGEAEARLRGEDTEALVMRWDGATWSIVETGITRQNATLSAVTVIAPDDVWAAGSYSDASGTVLKPLLIHWNGVEWSEAETNTDGAIWGMAAKATDDVWAVGSFGPQTLALHWDGETWRRVATPNPGDGRGNNVLNAVEVTEQGRVWAVGSYSEERIDRALAMEWDGREWKQQPAPSPGDYSDVLWAVEAVPGGGGEMWAAGATIADPLGNNLPLILRYSEPCLR